MPDIQLAERKTVLQILESFKGTGPLRELLAQLNYDPLNEPVSRKDWPEPAQVALAQDPRLYGRAAGEFYVVYAQLAADKLKLTDERTVIPQLLKQYPYALFVFSDKAQSNFHFVNVKWENNQKRRLYRRITVGPQERMRTAAERLSMLDIQTIDAGLFGVTAQHIQDRHDEAFDVAKVSKSFFDEYKRVFEVMRDAVKGFGTSDEEQDRRHLFTQRLFNRLMFLRFIQKKGWLTIDGSTDYLAALWASHGKLKQDGKNFYTDRLRLLFAALNNERAGIVLQGGGGAVEATIGKVKYLNGGLFEETDEDKDPKVRIADEPFKQIFDKVSGLFEAFNFTITESTPLDIEIAVDPEMLGKIFEELVTGRHDSGSYYTPKPIVSFMCREALKGYLEAQVPDEDKRALTRFIDKHEAEEVRNAEAVLNALRRVTVCDPACGSGAYLLGMMHELLDLRQCLFQTRQVDDKTMYQRKLDIIQTNLYGVDIAEFAVNIARLRLWLSLAVDYDGPEPQPLPNLEYKIEIGDTVFSPSPGAAQRGLADQFVNTFAELKKAYLVAHHADKAALRKKVNELRETILGHACPGETGFVWFVDFAEVFSSGGFDVVIANPPYISGIASDKEDGFRDQVRAMYDTARGAFDIYVVFYELALRIAASGGAISLITPNKVLSAEYATGLRKLLIRNATLVSILDLSKAQPFGAAVYPVVLTYFKRTTERIDHVNIYQGEKTSGEFYSIIFKVTTPVLVLASFPEGVWSPILSDQFSTYAQVFISCARLEDFCVVRQSASVDEAYKVIAPLLRENEAKKRKNVARFLISGTIDRYAQAWGKRIRYLKTPYLNPVLKIDSPPLNTERVHQIRSPKIIVSGQALYPKAFWDELGEYASGIPTVLLYDSTVPLGFLCGVVNSSAFADMYKILWSTLAMSGGYLRFGPPQLRRMPVPKASESVMNHIAKLVQERHTLGWRNDLVLDESAAYELEIEEAVCGLYGIAIQATSRYASSTDIANAETT